MRKSWPRARRLRSNITEDFLLLLLLHWLLFFYKETEIWMYWWMLFAAAVALRHEREKNQEGKHGWFWMKQMKTFGWVNLTITFYHFPLQIIISTKSGLHLDFFKHHTEQDIKLFRTNRVNNRGFQNSSHERLDCIKLNDNWWMKTLGLDWWRNKIIERSNEVDTSVGRGRH